MTTTNAIEVLTRLKACPNGIDEVREAGSLRAAWDLSTSRANMMWLLGALHKDGRLSRQRLVRVAVRCAEVVAHLMPAEALPHLATVASWANGGDDVSADEIEEAQRELWRIRAAYAYAYAATTAAYAATTAAYAYAYAAADAAAYAAAYAYDAAAYATTAAYAATTAAYAYAYAAADAAICDVIRDEVDADEVAAAMGVSADEVLS